MPASPSDRGEILFEVVEVVKVRGTALERNLKSRSFILHNIYKFSSYLTGNAIHLRYVARNSGH
jgi:hypothetical protein